MTIVGEAHVIVRAITSGFEDDIQRAVRRANLTGQGSTAGQQFSRGFSGGASKGFSKFAAEAEQARLALQMLVIKGNFVGPAIAGAASAIGALGAGLVSFGSQVGLAAQSLIVLPGLMSAVMQAAITAKLALGGVFKAVGELGKAKTKSVDQMPAKLKAFESAQRRVQNAQEALNRAYREAEERLQQLGFDTEDAALAQQRAGLALEDARATLARVQDLPPNSRARQEAELAFQEADLNYRRAIDRSNDLTEEQNRVTQNGTLNAEQQVNQSDEVLKAQQELRDSTVALYDAQKALNEANKTGASSTPEFSKLSKEAQEFAKYLVSLKPKIQELKDAAGKEMFGPLQEATQNLVDNLFPRLKPLLEETGKAFGNTMLDFSNIVTQEQNLKNFEAVGKTNVDTIGKFGKVAGNLYSALLSLLSAADPLIRRFTDWVVTLTDGWKATAEAKKQSGELTEKFNIAGDAAAQIGRILGNLGRALKDIGGEASGPGSGGQMLMDSFEGATKKFEEFVAKIKENGKLAQYFRDIVPTIESIGRILAGIVGGIAKMGDNKETATAFQSLEKTVPVVFGALERFNKATPALGEFVRKLTELLAKFADSESINIFFWILGKILDVLNAIFSNKIVAKVFIFAASLKAVMSAFAVANMVLGFYGKAIAGTIFKVIGLGNATKGAAIVQGLWNKLMHTSWLQTKLLQAMYLKDAIVRKVAAAATKVWTGVQAAFNAVMAGNPIALVVLAIVALIAIIIVAYKKFDWFRNFIDGVFSAIKSVILGVWAGIQAYFEFYWNAISASISFVWENVIKPVFNAIGAVFSFIWSGIKLAFDLYWNAISTAISFVWDNVIKPVFQAFGTVFSKVWDGIKTAFSTTWNFITGAISKAKEIFGGLGDAIKGAFKTAFNFVADAWNNTIGKIGFKAPKWLGGWEFSVPDIPRLAEGGIIAPRPGGMAAIIGEAGRPERVEPLDPDGLSKRDKAMIKLLAGGQGGGVTINVHPSPGMNEVELAALVNRQLAFELRKGAA